MVNEAATTEFILLNIGWRFPKYIHALIAIEEGKFRFFANNTDIEFSDIFVEKGIPKSDVLIEFVHLLERGVEYA